MGRAEKVGCRGNGEVIFLAIGLYTLHCLKFARFLYEDKVFFGSVKEDKIAVLQGLIWGDFEETKVEYPLSEVKFLPPVLPTKIVCFGMNYIEHFEEIGAKVPEKPHFFLVHATYS
jgi:2-keto-4-pentenoate hydratase/2-oxohepta-3-ene-1,7-dioic acid hydratase in catechol pathway